MVGKTWNHKLKLGITNFGSISRLSQMRHQTLKTLAALARVQKWLDNPHLDYLQAEAIRFRDELKATLGQGVDLTTNLNIGDIDQSILPLSMDQFFNLYDVFTSKNVFSGSLHDLEGVRRILGSVAKLDRLPASNSLEALNSLQEAWDYVEVYHKMANHYKLLAKIMYLLLLLIGIGVVLMSIVSSNIPPPSFSPWLC